MNNFTFKDGTVVTTKLSLNEYLKRYNRLDALRVMTEGYSEGVGLNICNKALKAENKNNDFTGIIRLTTCEKDFLSYGLEDNTDNEEMELINYYCRS